MRRAILGIIAVLLVGVAIGLFLRRNQYSAAIEKDRTFVAQARIKPPVSAPAEPARTLQIVSGRVGTERAARIEGNVVTRGTERGIASAEITFEQGGKAFSTRTDAKGHFAFEPRETGIFSLAAITAAGHLPFAPDWGSSPIVLNIGPTTAIQDLHFSLNPAVEYVARVLDPSGRPLANAEVRIWTNAEQILYPIRETFVTNSAGESHFSASEGTLVQASHPGYGYARATVDFRAQITREVVLRLEKRSEEFGEPKTISGIVTDEADRVIAGAEVTAEFTWGGSSDASLHPGGKAQTDSHGAFRIAGLDTGSYEVVASVEDYAPAVKRRVPAGTENLRLRLSQGARLRGRVTDSESGRPIASFTIVAFRRWGALQRAFTSEKSFIDPDGRFEVGPYAAGEYAFVAGAAGHSTAEVTVDLRSTTNATADFALDRGGAIFGIVVDEVTRQPLPDARVRLESSSPNLLLIACDTDSSGRFELRDVPLGIRSIHVLAQKHHAKIVSGLQIDKGQARGPLTIELAPVREGEEPRVEMAGIGAVLGAEENVLVFGRVVAGGGAAEVGLSQGDAILEIDGVPVPSLGFEGAINRIRGPENSEVLLKIRKREDDSVVILRVPRRRIRG